MTIEQAKTLVENKSFVIVAGSKYRFAGLQIIAGGASMIAIYDEPPSKHVDLWNIQNVQLVE